MLPLSSSNNLGSKQTTSTSIPRHHVSTAPFPSLHQQHLGMNAWRLAWGACIKLSGVANGGSSSLVTRRLAGVSLPLLPESSASCFTTNGAGEPEANHTHPSARVRKIRQQHRRGHLGPNNPNKFPNLMNPSLESGRAKLPNSPPTRLHDPLLPNKSKEEMQQAQNAAQHSHNGHPPWSSVPTPPTFHLHPNGAPCGLPSPNGSSFNGRSFSNNGFSQQLQPSSLAPQPPDFQQQRNAQHLSVHLHDQDQSQGPQTQLSHSQPSPQQLQSQQRQQQQQQQQQPDPDALAAAEAARKEVLLTEVPHDICMVQDGAAAKKVVDYLISKSRDEYIYMKDSNIFHPKVKPDLTRYFACDTEVAYIDIKSDSPVGHGCVNCFSIYCGDDIDFREALASGDASSISSASPPPSEHSPVNPGSSSNAVSTLPADSSSVASSSACAPPSTSSPDSSVGTASSGASSPPVDGSSLTSSSSISSTDASGTVRASSSEGSSGKGQGDADSSVHSVPPTSAMPVLSSVSSVPQRRLWVDVWGEVEKDADGKPIFQGGKVVLKPQHPILEEFKRFFEDDGIAKVWHNYGFDRHVMANLGIECQGFRGDTLHMARLADASRSGKKNYSLESLTSDREIMCELSPLERKDKNRVGRGMPGALTAKKSMKDCFGQKRLMKDGKTEGKLLEVPPMHVLHEDPKFRPTWVEYSARDAQATWLLREALYRKLKNCEWRRDPYLSNQLKHKKQPPAGKIDRELTLYEFYQQYWIDFGRILTDMEKYGMMVNREHLREAQVQAEKDRELNLKVFMKWAGSKVPDAKFMNAGSGSQIRQLLFPKHPGTIGKPKAAPPASVGSSPEPSSAGGAKKRAAPKANTPVPPGCRVFKVPRTQDEIDEDVARGKKRPSKNKDITLHSIWGQGAKNTPLVPEVFTATGAAAVSISVLKGLSGKPGAARKALEALNQKELEEEAAAAEAELEEHAAAARVAAEKERLALENPSPLEDELDSAEAKLHDTGEVDELGNRSTSTIPFDEDEVVPDYEEAHPAEQQTAGNSAAAEDEMKDSLQMEAEANGYGKLYVAMGGGREGLEACVAIEALCEVSAIDKLLNTFIIPLQSDNISTSCGDSHRIHCSLNINTETGRLSARRPNLQNQPALEKDRYKVRKAFTAFDAGKDNGKTLVVADYGQLELRILAHVADCKSMLDAFVLGGDFHSRTAYGMYDEIQADIAAGNSYLEWEGEGAPDKPLLKDKFAAERRKAKILNFSIAYGKTAYGLSKDFNTSREEAQQIVERWYADRKEVKIWQEQTTSRAKKEKPVPFVSSLLGRTRPLPDLNSKDRRKAGHAQRASINTPIQGSAADVASSAMLAIDKCEELKRMGWRLVMQVHDEVILEGPKETAMQAKDLVVKHMAHPWAWAAHHKDEHPQDGVQPLRVKLEVDANTADTWYEAK